MLNYFGGVNFGIPGGLLAVLLGNDPVLGDRTRPLEWG